MALFRIDGLFELTKRGQVLEGEIVNGEIAKGDIVLLPGDAASIKIISVEFIDHGKGVARIGLMVGYLNDDIYQALKSSITQAVQIEKAY